MNAFEMMDRLEDKALANAAKRLRKLSDAELLVLWLLYNRSDALLPAEREDFIRDLAIELVMDDR